VEGDGGLAGPGPTLDDEQLVHRRPDHVVLLGLDGGHDLAHRAGALGADLGEHRVGDAAGDVGRLGVVEVLVEVGGDGALVHREAPAEVDTERVRRGGAVERRGDRRPPVDHDGVVAVVLDVAATDVPPLEGAGRSVAGVDAAEEVAGSRRAQVLQRLLDGDLDVLGRELVGRALRIDALEALDHPVPGRAREGQPLALDRQLGKRIRT
jgi:hypothetical protein